MEKKNNNAKRIITRADDVGSFHSANAAIFDAYRNGVLRNGSFIVPGRRFDEAVELFKNEKGFCAGIHTALTCEWCDVRWRPILPPEKIPSVVRNDGTLHYTTMDLFKNGAKFDEMLAEIRAQVDKARKTGLDIKYVDSHMNFLWHYETSEQHRFDEIFHRWAESEGLISNVEVSRIPRLPQEGEDPIENLANRIRALGPGTYLIVSHPCFNDPEMRTTQLPGEPVGTQAAKRDIERRMFMDPSILKAFNDNGVEPIRFTEA
jgi:chitin disaccharide deacetylase